jgi:hypothetical protein
MAAVGEHAERRLYEKRDDPGQRERDPDLEIAQPERLPDLRPGSLSGAVQELIEELDGEENGDEAGSTPPAPARGCALAGRARKAHVLEPTGASAAWKVSPTRGEPPPPRGPGVREEPAQERISCNPRAQRPPPAARGL